MLMVNELIGFGVGSSGPASVGNTKSIDLDGTTQYGTAAVGPGALPVTFLCWMYPDSVADALGIFRFGVSTANTGNVQLNIAASGAITGHQPGLVQTFTATGAVTTGAWQMVTMTIANGAMSSTNPKYYVNASAVAYASQSGSGTPVVSATDMTLGRYNSTNNFDGKFAMAAVWSAQLGATEIAEIHAAGAGTALTANFGNYTSSANLLYHWAIEEGSGTNLADQNAAAAITLVGSPTWSSSVP